MGETSPSVSGSALAPVEVIAARRGERRRMMGAVSRMNELSCARDGPRCMIMPLRRDELKRDHFRGGAPAV